MMPEWILALWKRCVTRFTGVLHIHFLDGKPMKATVEEVVKPD